MDTKVQLAYIASGSSILGLITTAILSKLKRKKKKKILTISESDLFPYLDRLELDIIMNFKVSEDVESYEAKQEVFKDIMINKLKNWKVIVNEIADKVKCCGNCNKCSVSLIESRTLHMDMLAKGILKYNNYYKNDEYTAEQKKAIDICLPKFNKIHNPNADTISDMIELTHTNTKYFGKFCPVMASGLIFSAYKQAFNRMIHDISKTIDQMNGDLKGLKFKRRKY